MLPYLAARGAKIVCPSLVVQQHISVRQPFRCGSEKHQSGAHPPGQRWFARFCCGASTCRLACGPEFCQSSTAAWFEDAGGTPDI